jgi:hypothetical protein
MNLGLSGLGNPFFQERYTVPKQASALFVWMVFSIAVAYAEKENRKI